MSSILYALHDFEAENADELSFSAGEPITLIEADDAYDDGWYLGRNTLGEVGLFPQSYTSAAPPSDSPAGSLHDSGALDHAPDGASVRSAQSQPDPSGFDRAPSDDGREEEPLPANPRAVLAAKAAANAEKEAREQREAVELRRKEDELEYEKTRNLAPVSGLQLSDESGDEEDELAVPSFIKPDPSISDVANSNRPHPISTTNHSAFALPNGSRSPIVPTAIRSTAFVIPSLSAPANDLSFASPKSAGPTSVSLMPSLSRSTTGTTRRPSSSVGDEHEAEDMFESSHSGLEAALGAMGAGALTTAAAVGAVFSPHDDPEPPVTTPVAPSSLPQAAEAILHDSKNDSKNDSLAALPVTDQPFGSPHSGHSDHRSLPPIQTSDPLPVPIPTPTPAPVASTSHIPAPLSFFPASSQPRTNGATSPSSMQSGQHSLAGSRIDHAQPTSTNGTTGETSPLPSVAGENGKAVEDLPYDPREWGVVQVVDWGKSKGFDAMTLSKFEEHEISGDVLIEMDVAMLKEIDLIAFGRRVHIFNAIKELKSRITTSSSSPDLSAQPVFSPTPSGYDADPGTPMSFASPATTGRPSFASIPPTPTTLDHATLPLESPRGLGFVGAGMTPPAAKSRALHQRTDTVGTTSDSFNTADGTIDERLVQEEKADGVVPLAYPALNKIPIPIRRPSTQPSLASSYMSSRRSEPDFSAPTSPNTSRVEKTKQKFFSVGKKSRKPAPQASDSEAFSDPQGSVGTARRATRLFASFSGGSGSEKQGNSSSARSITSRRPASTTQRKTTTMTAQKVDAATAEMTRAQAQQVTEGNLLEKIGKPDYSGWMMKKGEKYNSWKQRFFVLKGIHLYYLKAENEQKVKGFVNLSGYRVLADPEIHVGEFGFKIVHDTDRTHYFSAAEQVTVRNWMKEIMKATIGRDYSAEVTSSCNVDTMPLAIAQTMNPRPRPPSPTSRARVQKERYAGINPNTLSPKDAALLMEAFDGLKPALSPNAAPGTGSVRSRSSKSISKLPRPLSSVVIPPSPVSPISPSSIIPLPLPIRAQNIFPSRLSGGSPSQNSSLLSFVNDNLPPSCPRATNLSTTLRSGRVLTRLVEKLSGKSSGISDADFSKFKADAGGDAYDPEYFDTCFNVFDALTAAGVSTEDISMNDLLSGNEVKLTELVDRIRSQFILSLN